MTAVDGGGIDAARGVLTSGGIAARESAPRRRARRPLPYILVLPAIMVLVTVLGYPLAKLINLSFQKWGVENIFSDAGPRYIGLDNYVSVLTDAAFYRVLWRTLILTVAMVSSSMLIGVGIALLLERVPAWVRRGMTFTLVLAWAVPTFVSTQIFAWMTEQNFGVLNYLFGLGTHNWFINPVEGLTVSTIIVVWGAVPFITLTTYAALTQVPAELVDAARVDGANAPQVFRNITLPTIRPVLTVVTALSVIWDFQVFNQIWILRNGAPSLEYQTLAIYAYFKAYQGHEYGYAAAVAVVTVLLLCLVMVYYLRQLAKIGDAE